ncbi:MAG: hypothetical protein WBV82_05360 [Myxococcaceae bacterium]
MNRLIVLCLVLSAVLAFADKPRDLSMKAMGKDPVIRSIRERFNRTNAQQAQLKEEEKSIEGYASDGATMTVFRHGDEIRKVVILAVSATGDGAQGLSEVTEYYFDGQKPYFVFVRSTQWDGEQTISKDENRYYFDGNRLVWWLTGTKPAPVAESNHDIAENRILRQAKGAHQGAQLQAKHIRAESDDVFSAAD